MTRLQPSSPAGDHRPVDDSPRYAWIMWAAWLVFLSFPVSEILNRANSPLVAGLGLAAVAGFAVTYLYGARGITFNNQIRSGSLWALAVMAILAAVIATVIGIDAIGLLPYLVSYGVFVLPRPWNWWVVAAIVAFGMALPFITGQLQQWGWFIFVLISVAIGTSGGRVMADSGIRSRQTSEILSLTAERERVARDVHDVLGHSLTVLSVKADLAAKLIDADPERATSELLQIQELSRQALAEIRETVGGLRAARLGDEITTARRALRDAGIEAALPDDVSALDPTRRTAAAWVLREAITNVVRHSRATRCDVGLSATGLTVTDDGIGVGDQRGNGLVGLQERVTSTGGTLIVGPAQGGQGTRLEARW